MIDYTLRCVKCGRTERIVREQPTLLVPPDWKHIAEGFVCPRHELRTVIVDIDSSE